MADVTVDSSSLADVRRENEHNFGTLKYDTAIGQSDIRREAEHNTATIRNDVLGTSSDIRRETMASQGAIQRDLNQISDRINDDIKSSAWKVSDSVGNNADRIVDNNTNYFIASQNRQFDNALAIAGIKASTDMGFAKIAGDISTSTMANALETAKLSGAMALGHAQLERSILQDGLETRRLMNELNADSLNRQLIERNAEMLDHRGEARHWRHGFENNQFAALTTQLNALGSVLNDTRQGVVNFGSMTGNAGRQQSTTNVV